MSKCVKWGSSTISQCTKWADQGSNQCVQWADQGSNQCTQWADQGSNSCSSWSPWFSWLCLAFYWVSNWVCVVTVWVAAMVCVTTLWVAAIVCIATIILTIPVCLLWEYVLIPFIRVTLFGLLAPFAAAIDAVCQSCYTFDWVKETFWFSGKIEFKSISDAPGQPGQFIYTFVCHCSKGKDVEVSVVASNDSEAADLAKEACAKAC